MATTSEQNGMYVIVRTYSAGVFAGTMVSREGQEVHLTEARRLWYWRGAMSLSELAVQGTREPFLCKFAVPVDVTVTQAIEILTVTDAARVIIESVPTWTR